MALETWPCSDGALLRFGWQPDQLTDAVALPLRGGGGGGAEVCNFPQLPRFPRIFILHFPAIFRNFPQSPAISRNFPQFPAIFRNFPHLPAISCNFSHFPAISRNFPHFPAISCNFPHFPAISRIFPQFPAFSRNFLHFPAIFRIVPQLSALFPQSLLPILRVRVGALCVPPAEVLLREAAGGSVTPAQFSRKFSASSCNSSPSDWAPADRNSPPPPSPQVPPPPPSQCWSRQTPARTRSVHLDAPGQRHGQQPRLRDGRPPE